MLNETVLKQIFKELIEIREKETKKRQCGTESDMFELYFSEFMCSEDLDGHIQFQSVLWDIAIFQYPNK